MTVKQKQWQLYLLGYLTGPEAIDGIWGIRSEAATLEFQLEYFPEESAWDGIFGPNTAAKSREIVGNIQETVAACGDLPLVNDGLAGSRTMEAVCVCQKALGLPATGIADKATCAKLRQWAESATDVTGHIAGDKQQSTGTFWDEIEFFSREEFRCQCGGRYCNGFPVEPQETMVRTVNEIRRRLGIPVSIVDAGGSGVRCRQHNAGVGGVANSLHLTGNAADLHSAASPEQMAQVAEEVMGATGEIGIYSWGIHVGIGKYSRFRG